MALDRWCMWCGASLAAGRWLRRQFSPHARYSVAMVLSTDYVTGGQKSSIIALFDKSGLTPVTCVRAFVTRAEQTSSAALPGEKVFFFFFSCSSFHSTSSSLPGSNELALHTLTSHYTCAEARMSALREKRQRWFLTALCNCIIINHSVQCVHLNFSLFVLVSISFRIITWKALNRWSFPFNRRTQWLGIGWCASENST